MTDEPCHGSGGAALALPAAEGPGIPASMGLSEAELAKAKDLLWGGSRQAFEDGAARVLLSAIERPVASVLLAERAEAYLTLLYALLLLRRDHEIEPLHEDVERFVAGAARAADPSWDGQAFGRDVAQLEAWGCLARRTEPLKIRGYRDIRRERFRYRLTDDAVALLEWLEARLEARVEGREPDSRDLLIDVLGSVKELSRVVRHWHQGERSEEAPRRALHLLTTIDGRVHAIGQELLAFRAQMVTFASRPYDLAALRAILAWLERYLGVYLSRIETLRVEIAARLSEIAGPWQLRALAELHALMMKDRAQAPTAFRGAGVLREPTELLAANAEFFADGGRLVELSARIDESARGVLRKMHRHLRELERRSARVEDLRARIDEIAALPCAEGDARISAFVNALVASAHGHFGMRGASPGCRLAPPMPRRHAAANNPRKSPPPLEPKRLAPDVARELHARRLSELKAWVEREVLAGRSEVRLSEAQLTAAAAPRNWLDVARARYLGHGRDLGRLALRLSDAPGTAVVTDGAQVLSAPDCIVVTVAEPRSRFNRP